MTWSPSRFSCLEIPRDKWNPIYYASDGVMAVGPVTWGSQMPILFSLIYFAFSMNVFGVVDEKTYSRNYLCKLHEDIKEWGK